MKQVVKICVTVILASILDKMPKGDAKLILHLRQVSGQVWHDAGSKVLTSLVQLVLNRRRAIATTLVRVGHLEAGCLGLDEYEKDRLGWISEG